MEEASGAEVLDLPVEHSIAKYWLWPIRISDTTRNDVSRIAEFCWISCKGWRWIPASILAGAIPFLLSYSFSISGHQLLSAILLTLLCISCAYQGGRLRGMGVMALCYLSHCMCVITFSSLDPSQASLVLPGAEAYWEKQARWITTGYDPEYQLINWFPAHLQLLGGAIILTYTSLGGIILFQGFYELDLMNYYCAQLLNSSNSQTMALGLGWHVWSILRGLGYVFIVFEVLSLSLERLMNRPLLQERRRWWPWLAGLAFLTADCILKATVTTSVQGQLFRNLS